MGSVGTSETTNSVLDMVTYNTDFDEWMHENARNKEFRDYYNEHHRDEGFSLEDIWRQKLEQEARKDIHQISIDEATDLITDNIRASALSGWFRNGDSDYKPGIINSVLRNKGVLNAALNVAYYNYVHEFGHYGIDGKFVPDNPDKTPMSFDKWVRTPMTMYRGDRGQQTIQSDIFSSYTPDKMIAARFTKDNTGQSSVKPDLSDVDQSRITTIKIRPIDTYGSYRTSAEREYLIPARLLNKKGAKKK